MAAAPRADKRLGQHFLLDLNICRKIARLAGPLANLLVIEIGPGPGALTRALIEAGARVIAVEKDPRFIAPLEEIAAAVPAGLSVVGADALAVDEEALVAAHAPGRPAVIVANLPYNIGTPLLVKWLTGPFRPVSMTLMFQKEVAQRIVAPVGGGPYGRLSVLVQALAEAKIVMDLPARAFTPPPKVASSVVRLTPFEARPADRLVVALQDITRAAFGQRRKMLRSSLAGLGGEDLCREAVIDQRARAEEVSVAGFLRLAAASLRRSVSGDRRAD
ncbi:MAG: 16S rRNA (adenine(1518)-N(6)/adenine(1519)-N(6))-dimethyltransferase RsmA [Caulobacteraceae bacterium]